MHRKKLFKLALFSTALAAVTFGSSAGAREVANGPMLAAPGDVSTNIPPLARLNETKGN